MKSNEIETFLNNERKITIINEIVIIVKEKKVVDYLIR